MGELDGKVALVTGGSRGIGAAVARRLAADGAGVAITYARDRAGAEAVAREVAAAGGRAVPVQADSADPSAVRGVVARAADELGGLDVLVNNAGIFPYGPIEDVGEEELERALAVHVKGSFVAAQAAVPRMRDGGAIVSIGSCLVDRVASPNMTLYTMSKSALVGLTKGLARDLGPLGITANVVHPGPIDTAMNPADGEGADHQRELLALGRFGTAEDVAATVAHLAGPGGRFITGAEIAVDGGHAA